MSPSPTPPAKKHSGVTKLGRMQKSILMHFLRCELFGKGDAVVSIAELRGFAHNDERADRAMRNWGREVDGHYTETADGRRQRMLVRRSVRSLVERGLLEPAGTRHRMAYKSGLEPVPWEPFSGGLGYYRESPAYRLTHAGRDMPELIAQVREEREQYKEFLSSPKGAALVQKLERLT